MCAVYVLLSYNASRIVEKACRVVIVINSARIDALATMSRVGARPLAAAHRVATLP